jgi:hypothetical protein
VLAPRVALAVALALGRGRESLRDPVLQDSFLDAAGRFWKAAPWQFWWSEDAIEVEATVGGKTHTYEACIMGGGGEEYGLALYTEKGALDAVARAMEAAPRLADVHPSELTNAHVEINRIGGERADSLADRLCALPDRASRQRALEELLRALPPLVRDERSREAALLLECRGGGSGWTISRAGSACTSAASSGASSSTSGSRRSGSPGSYACATSSAASTAAATAPSPTSPTPAATPTRPT